MAVVVVDEAELGIIELAGPLDGLFDTASRRTVGALAWQAIGGIGIAGAKGAVVAIDLADILGEIPATGVPGDVLLDGQRTGGYGLGRLTRRHPIACSPLRGKLAARFVQSPSELLGAFPGDVPQSRMGGAGEVDTDYLQVTSVDVALVLTCAVICLHL